MGMHFYSFTNFKHNSFHAIVIVRFKHVRIFTQNQVRLLQKHAIVYFIDRMVLDYFKLCNK